MPVKRYTNTELFNAVYQMAEASGELAKLAKIEDYHLAEDYESTILTRYDFDCLFQVNYGGSEGIYIDAYLHGIFDESKESKRLKLGTIKTLDTSLDAMKIMGEACGILTHFSSQFINSNIDNFTPEADLRRWGRWE